MEYGNIKCKSKYKGGTDVDLNWLQSISYGILSGLAEILPISAQAHQILLMKFSGVKETSPLFDFLIHFGVFVALYYHSQAQLIRMNRARSLARIPKKKRKRPLDTRSLMDWSMLKTMCIPAIIGIFLFRYTAKWETNFLMIALFLFINGIILYIPQFFPTGNRDSRTLSRIEGLLMGLGGTASALPGVSSIGATVSISSVCGVERDYGLTMALMMNLVLLLGRMVYDGMDIVNQGLGMLSLMMLLRYLLTMCASFLGTLLGIQILRRVGEHRGYYIFGIYCWGLALFIFILNLLA